MQSETHEFRKEIPGEDNKKTYLGSTRWERRVNKEGMSIKLHEEDHGEKKSLTGGKLSQAELRERSQKGLCFKCGDTWGRDHICKLKHFQFVLIEGSQGEE